MVVRGFPFMKAFILDKTDAEWFGKGLLTVSLERALA